jgi:HSP20 family protein
MVLCRLYGANPAQRVRMGFDRVFNDVFEGLADSVAPGALPRQALPAFNVWEDDRALHAEVEVPGVKMEDIEVLVQGDELTVKGTRQANEAEGITHHLRERRIGEFSRTLRIPFEVDTQNVEASLRDGVLTIELPKAQAAMPRKITVRGQ